MCQILPDIVSDSLHRAKNCHPETMSQIFPDIVSDSLHLAKSCPPETMCRISPNFAKLWSSITPKRQTMGAWHHLHLHPHEGVGENISGPQAISDISLKIRLTAQKISKCQNRHDFCRPETMSGESVPSSFCFLLSFEAEHTNKQTDIPCL